MYKEIGKMVKQLLCCCAMVLLLSDIVSAQNRQVLLFPDGAPGEKSILKETGDKVKKGDPLIEFDREEIAKEGFDTVVPIVICNTASYSSVKVETGDSVKTGDRILSVEK